MRRLAPLFCSLLALPEEVLILWQLGSATDKIIYNHNNPSSADLFLNIFLLNLMCCGKQFIHL